MAPAIPALLCRDLRENLFIGKVAMSLQTIVQDSRTAGFAKFCGLEIVFYTKNDEKLSEAVRCY
jgi:hypothetical protein